MLDAAMLARISECYTAAALTDEAKKHYFGGKDMVIIGDLMQLPPVSEWRNVKPLYHDMVTSALQQNSSRFNKEKRLIDGLTIFEGFCKFELTKQMRCSDKVHTNHVETIRVGNATQPVCCQSPLMCVSKLTECCDNVSMCANMCYRRRSVNFLFFQYVLIAVCANMWHLSFSCNLLCSYF